MDSGLVISPAISATLTRLVASVAQGIDILLVGPSGCGLSTVAHLVSSELVEQAIPVVTMDCRAIAPWQEAYRQSCQAANEIIARNGRSAALVIDHCGDMESKEVKEAYQEVSTAAPGKFHARLWVGSLDCRRPDIEDGLPLIRDPKALVLMPEYHRDDLLRIYPIVGHKQGCEWGEAILYFLHDY